MTFAIFRATLLGLFRDRGALVMSFVVPILFFVIFAEIFASAADSDIQLRVAIVDEVKNDESVRLLAAFTADASIRPVPGSPDRAKAEELVRRGTADVGLVVRADGEPLATAMGFGEPPLLLLVDPSRGVTATIVTGQLQKAYFAALPDLAVGRVAALIGTQFTRFTPAQQDSIDAGLKGMRDDASAATQPGWSFESLLQRMNVAGQSAALNHVAYYAGGIAFMFLLFAAAQTALGILDERENGILDRIAAGPGGIGAVINGKFLYLVIQGFVQTAIIFAVAWLAYGVDVPGHFGRWLSVTLVTAVAAAGIGLVLVTACRTRVQAQILPTVVILIVSAMGGSMVPRFFMPRWLQQLGWATPNTWAIETWSGVFWRDDPVLSLAPLCIIMALTGLAGLAISHLLARRLVAD